jgi:hypothetical protein
MGSKELRTRATWQDYSGDNAAKAERSFEKTFQEHFLSSDFRIRSKPSEFRDIYVGFPLSPEVKASIYNPPEQIKRHGIMPDYAIDNVRSKKTLYIEVKRQDGWVEGGKRSDGRGNAHERSCKYFTPGISELLREKGGIREEKSLPFWVVFMGDVTRDPCRVREISFWYQNFESHFFMWRDQSDSTLLLAHFDSRLKHLLL